MPEVVHELSVSETAREKLGRRGISADEAQQTPWNPHRLEVNPRERGTPRQLRRRRLLHGETNGGRGLILVIEVTLEPTTWDVITGWDS
ncbi:MAG TPA: hypothetical protein VEB65_04080 [Solirubrobacterales bacterium]|nr:hypothetical protein [Solirubrobacterales bacterium]